MTKKLNIVFMGTPDFAVGILDYLIENNMNVVGVITAPDKPAGRGRKINTSAVKDYALQKNLPILQPTNLKSEDFLEELAALQADLQIVVAFRMLPKVVWDMSKYGTFNLHASLLPQYRGAAPINWAIINGEEKTGVTTFFLDDQIDTGQMIAQTETTIGTNETAGELHDRLMNIGKETVLETIHQIAENRVVLQKQPEGDHKTAHKLNKDNCKIDWTKSAQAIHDHIRGLSPYPAAWANLNNGGEVLKVKIYQSSFENESHDLTIGKIITDHKKKISVATKDGYLHIHSLQLPGKKRMETQALLNGVSLAENACFD